MDSMMTEYKFLCKELHIDDELNQNFENKEFINYREKSNLKYVDSELSRTEVDKIISKLHRKKLHKILLCKKKKSKRKKENRNKTKELDKIFDIKKGNALNEVKNINPYNIFTKNNIFINEDIFNVKNDRKDNFKKAKLVHTYYNNLFIDEQITQNYVTNVKEGNDLRCQKLTSKKLECQLKLFEKVFETNSLQSNNLIFMDIFIEKVMAEILYKNLIKSRSTNSNEEYKLNKTKLETMETIMAEEIDCCTKRIIDLLGYLNNKKTTSNKINIVLFLRQYKNGHKDYNLIENINMNIYNIRNYNSLLEKIYLKSEKFYSTLKKKIEETKFDSLNVIVYPMKNIVKDKIKLNEFMKKHMK